jgi:ornithine cyclodeaminase/alanine dehydrogenase-like protein (mu-crystallin family)
MRYDFITAYRTGAASPLATALTKRHKERQMQGIAASVTGRLRFREKPT